MVSQIVEEFQAKKAKSKLNQARILVTGSSGFIGSAIFNNLKSDFQVTGLSRKSEAGLKMDLFKEQIDLSDFEYVIHAAGLAHLKQTDKDAMHQNNVLATRNLLNGLNPSALKGFVFCSTVAVYGIQNGVEIEESETPTPNDSYGTSKLQAEELIAEWCKTHAIPFLILRLPLVVGKKAPGNINRLIDSMRRGRFFLLNGNESKRSMVLLGDLVELIRLQITNGIKSIGIYNITDGTGVGFNDFVLSVCFSKGFKKPISIPFWLAKLLAVLGSMLGGKLFSFSIIEKMTQTLTFSNQKAQRDLLFSPSQVLLNLKENI